MKNGRTIRLKNRNLIQLRNFLRQVIKICYYEEFKSLSQKTRIAYKQGNKELSGEFSRKRHILMTSIKNSICSCVICSNNLGDMTYLIHPDYARDGAWFCEEHYDFYANYDKRETFRINKYLTLRLEKCETSIYVNNEHFLFCHLLLINIPVSHSIENTEMSVDALEDHEYTALELREFYVPCMSRFLANCSNIQAWAEYDYDTRLLHRNLAFPLLKELTKAGDLKARKVFKEEIAKRYISNNSKVQEYLRIEGFLDILSKEEKEAIGIED